MKDAIIIIFLLAVWMFFIFPLIMIIIGFYGDFYAGFLWSFTHFGYPTNQ